MPPTVPGRVKGTENHQEEFHLNVFAEQPEIKLVLNGRRLQITATLDLDGTIEQARQRLLDMTVVGHNAAIAGNPPMALWAAARKRLEAADAAVAALRRTHDKAVIELQDCRALDEPTEKDLADIQEYERRISELAGRLSAATHGREAVAVDVDTERTVAEGNLRDLAGTLLMQARDTFTAAAKEADDHLQFIWNDAVGSLIGEIMIARFAARIAESENDFAVRQTLRELSDAVLNQRPATAAA
jgi:hypothetical protein